jgi:hypothetical protein
MFDVEFVFETSVIAFVLTFFITYNNFSVRKKMNDRLGDECKEKMSFFFKHPFLTIIINFGIFVVVTAFVKFLYFIIFKD